MPRLLILAALTLSASIAAAEPAQVEMVQPPASVGAGDEQRPLAPGMALGSGDLLHVGDAGRLRLRLAEGSAVKVGSDARLRLTQLRAAADGDGGGAVQSEGEGGGGAQRGDAVIVNEPGDRGVFRGLLDIIGGAFRFTTDSEAEDRARDIEFRVGPFVTGIRGTDIWGKATADRQFVVLLEGEVDVRVDSQTGRLTQPGTAVVASNDGEPQIGVSIDPDTIQRFARETEPVEGQARLIVDGPWIVMLDTA
ncbi:MAG: hypothetical protein WEC99_00660, partial [Halofilum sp. (in: g-proteobacteria)]